LFDRVFFCQQQSASDNGTYLNDSIPEPKDKPNFVVESFDKILSMFVSPDLSFVMASE